MEDEYYIQSGKDHQQVIQFLEDKLYEHNSTKINKENGNLFSKFVVSESREIIAGIAGWTWAGACEITQLWVDNSARKNGIGKMLLKMAETEAKKRGCFTIVVRSYSFQAPEFYEKHGYKAEHVIDDFPIGHRYYILMKKIT